MRLKVLLLSLIVMSWIGLFPSSAKAVCGEGDSGICDTVRVGCPFRIATVVPGDSIMVPIYIWNDELLGGFSLGFTYDSTELEIVKKTYDTTASVIPFDSRSDIKENILAAGQYLIGWIDWSAESPILATTTNNARLLITLNFKVRSTATRKIIVIDSLFIPPHGPFVLSTQFGYSLGPQYMHCPEGDIILGDTPCGDADVSQDVNLVDVVYLINYIFRGGAPPQDIREGDVDCDLRLTIADVVYLINYIFSGGLAPCERCY